MAFRLITALALGAVMASGTVTLAMSAGGGSTRSAAESQYKPRPVDRQRPVRDRRSSEFGHCRRATARCARRSRAGRVSTSAGDCPCQRCKAPIDVPQTDSARIDVSVTTATGEAQMMRLWVSEAARTARLDLSGHTLRLKRVTRTGGGTALAGEDGSARATLAIDCNTEPLTIRIEVPGMSTIRLFASTQDIDALVAWLRNLDVPELLSPRGSRK